MLEALQELRQRGDRLAQRGSEAATLQWITLGVATGLAALGAALLAWEVVDATLTPPVDVGGEGGVYVVLSGRL